MLLFGTVFYMNLKTSLETSFDAMLQLHTQQIAAGISKEHGTIDIQDVTGELIGFVDNDDLQSTTSQKESKVDVNLGALVRILDAQGRTFYVSPAFRALRVPSISITAALHGASWQGIVTAHNGQPVRLYSRVLTDNDGKIFGVLQVGASLASLNATLRSVMIELLIIGPFVLLLGAIGSYWLARHAFVPINRLTRTARRIEAGDLHERVPVPHARDEVQELALTFNQMIERLDKAFARQRRFVADASHELRTPVATIRSITDVVLAQNTSIEKEEYRTVLHEVNAEAERLGHLISDLLALASADEGQTLLEREPVRLDLLTADVAATLEPLATERGITLEIQADESVTVLGDEVRLIQVIMNLIDNAFAYTNAGGKVLLSVEIKNSRACLIIRDTGIGIAPEHLGHIFERFYRADPARSGAAGGTGLGLSIVDWVVRAHNGTISVESQVGQGTTFTVILPLAP
jgi:heavy metal sensor kinase